MKAPTQAGVHLRANQQALHASLPGILTNDFLETHGLIVGRACDSHLGFEALGRSPASCPNICTPGEARVEAQARR